MRTSLKLTCAAFALAGVAAPALAVDTIVPTFAAQKTYFHCAGTTKISNVGLVEGAVPAWNTTAPAASVQAGAGCGYATTGPLSGTGQKTIYDAAFEGTFTGNLDAMTVRLHDINVGPSRNTRTATVTARLTIDGHSLFGMTGANSKPATLTNVPLVASSTGATSEIVFSLSKLGFKFEDGNGTEEHTVLLTVDVSSDVVNGIVMDTTETPSGIDFNPATLSTSVAQATDPAPKPEVIEE